MEEMINLPPQGPSSVTPAKGQVPKVWAVVSLSLCPSHCLTHSLKKHHSLTQRE